MAGTKLIDEVKLIKDIDDRIDSLEKYGIYKTLGDLKNAKAQADLPYTLLTSKGRVEYTYIAGNYTDRIDDINVISLNNTASTVGALIKSYSGSLNYDGRSVEEKLKDSVSVKDAVFLKGAKGAPFDDTEVIQAALDSGATSILFPPGEYLFRDLVTRTPYQRLRGPGAKLTRISPTGTFKILARGVHLVEMRFGCQSSGMAGNNITIGAPDCRLVLCESRDCAGRALLVTNAGGGICVMGGVYQTTGSDTNSYDIEFKDDVGGNNTLYCWVTDVITNQHTGGILISGEVGSSAIIACEFGKLTMDNTGAAKIDNCRIGGKVAIRSGFASVSQTDFNDDIIVGTEGSSTNIGSIRFDSTNSQKSGKSFKLCSNVVESSFHLDQLKSSGSIITVESYNNDIWLSDIKTTWTLGALGGGANQGSSVIDGYVSCLGRTRKLYLSASFNDSAVFGSGVIYFSSSFTARRNSVGQAIATAQGRFWNFIPRIMRNENQILLIPSSGTNSDTDAPGIGVTGAYPVSLVGATIDLHIDFEQTFG